MIAASLTVALADSFKITITNNDQISAHTYTAYKIFSGTLNANKDGLGDVTWADETAGANLLTKILADNTLKNKFASSDTALDVSKKLPNLNAAELERFAELAGETFTTSAGSSTGSGPSYEITVDSVGYYLVKDTGTIANGDSASSIMMKVVGDTSITAKSQTVPNEKKIVENNQLKDANTAAVGDTVNYVVTSKIPDVTHYEKYFFIVHDTMSTGLTFNGTVTAEYGTLAEGTFTKEGDIAATSLEIRTKDTTPEADDGDTFTCIVKDAKTLFTGKAGKTIRFYYSATVNQSAVIGVTGNINTESIEYSDNPNVTPKGENKPDNEDVTGKTPTDKTITYVAGLEIQKIDGATKLPLAGAKFKITANELNQIKKVTKTGFTEAADGTYWKLKDGSYTTTDPATATLSDAAKAKYLNDGKKYKPTESVVWETVAVADPKVSSEITVGDDGVLHLEGLNAGTYTLTETEAPKGYNKLTYDIVVKITATPPTTVSADTDEVTWKYQTKKSTDANFGNEVTASTAIAYVEVENNSGATLPSTGGIGTTLFYVGGGILVLLAVVLLVTKKRMGAND